MMAAEGFALRAPQSRPNQPQVSSLLTSTTTDSSISPCHTETEGKAWSLTMTDMRAFAKTVPFGPRNAAARVAAAADFNRDGWQDLVVGDERTASMVAVSSV
jgi:hypothetical protein